MVLNVLATRSLPEARSFLTRTFGAFLSGKGREVKQAEAEALEEEAEEALQRVRTKYKLDLGIGGAASDETR